MITGDSIVKSYGSIKALNGLSFDISGGEIFGFIGPDGAGKTSLFRILTSLLLPDSGRATIKGFDVVKDYKKIRTIIGYMPGQFSLYSDLTVEENLRFFASVFGTSIEKNYHLIREIYSHIEPFRKRLAGRLSGGMKQKLALSCALIHEPDVLILDEPTTGVDAVSRREFWELLKGLKKRGITMVVSTPYMDEADLCDRIALIQDGALLVTGSPEEVKNSYGEEILAIYAADMYRLLSDVRDYPYCAGVFPFGRELHYSDRRELPDSEDLLKFLEKKQHRDIQIKPIKAGIEDVFMKMMKTPHGT